MTTTFALIGRDRELAQFDAILAQHRPSLVIVSGEAGMGKTSLLQEVRRRADEQGWKTIPDDPMVELSIAPDTTEDIFRDRVRELLSISAEEGFSDTIPALNDGDIRKRNLPGQTETPKSDDSGMSMRISEEAGQSKIEEWNIQSQRLCEIPSESKSGRLEQLTTQPRRPRLHTLVEQLRRRVPVLLFIDGYRSGDNFVNWFTGYFIKDVKRSEAPIVVVVADQPKDVSKLEPFADLHVSLGPLDSQSIKQLLETIGQQMTPPMEAAELEEYIKEVCKKPEILGSLIRVLQLAQPVAL